LLRARRERPRHRAAEQRDDSRRFIQLSGRQSAPLVRLIEEGAFASLHAIASSLLVPSNWVDLVVVLQNKFDVAGILNGLRCVEPLFELIQQFVLVFLRDRLVSGDLRDLFFFFS
jgi:hypothetical protein